MSAARVDGFAQVVRQHKKLSYMVCGAIQVEAMAFSQQTSLFVVLAFFLVMFASVASAEDYINFGRKLLQLIPARTCLCQLC